MSKVSRPNMKQYRLKSRKSNCQNCQNCCSIKMSYVLHLELSFKLTHNVPTLCVRAGFRSTKLSTQHKSPIGKLNLNVSTSPRMTQNVCYSQWFFQSSLSAQFYYFPLFFYSVVVVFIIFIVFCRIKVNPNLY